MSLICRSQVSEAESDGMAVTAGGGSLGQALLLLLISAGRSLIDQLCEAALGLFGEGDMEMVPLQ